MITSPLRYPGGKAKLALPVAELIRLNGLFSNIYCEPYAGGAGLAIKLLTDGFVPRIKLNDVDDAIYSFWRAVFDETDEFCSLIDSCNLTVEEWRNQREIYQSSNDHGIRLGFAAFYLNRTSRSGIIEGSGPIGGIAQEGDWRIDARFNRATLIDNIRNLAKFRDQVDIYCLDALEFLDLVLPDDECFVYLDPPYYVKGRKLYKNFYTHDDHVSIRDKLEEFAGSKWIVSYDDVKAIREIYEPRTPLNYQLNYSAGPISKGAEVMFASDEIALPRLGGVAA